MRQETNPERGVTRCAPQGRTDSAGRTGSEGRRPNGSDFEDDGGVAFPTPGHNLTSRRGIFRRARHWTVTRLTPGA